MSGSFAVFVWHIRQTLEPTEIRLRVSRCCCPRPPGDTCCVSQPFKLQAEPSGAVADGCCCIGMLHSCSKLTVESAREKDTYGTWCICMIHHVPALIYTPFAIAAPGFKRLFSVADRKSDNSSRQWSLYPIIVYRFLARRKLDFPNITFHIFGLLKEKGNFSFDKKIEKKT